MKLLKLPELGLFTYTSLSISLKPSFLFLYMLKYLVKKKTRRMESPNQLKLFKCPNYP